MYRRSLRANQKRIVVYTSHTRDAEFTHIAVTLRLQEALIRVTCPSCTDGTGTASQCTQKLKLKKKWTLITIPASGKNGDCIEFNDSLSFQMFELCFKFFKIKSNSSYSLCTYVLYSSFLKNIYFNYEYSSHTSHVDTRVHRFINTFFNDLGEL